MKKKRKKNSASLLTRLFKKGGKKKGAGGKAGAEKARPLTPRQRSIAEIKQMKKIGDNDPERLAQILSTILGDEQVKERIEKEKLDQLVWDIIHKKEQGSGGEGEGGETNEVDGVDGVDEEGVEGASPN
jgi:phosphopantothenoylcysteine synthetase/decarboxylase